MLTSLMTIACALWVTYIYFQKRQKMHLCLACLLYLQILPGWPLYWSQLISFGLMSIVLAGLLFYEARLKKEKTFIAYGLMALGMGCVFFIQVLPANHVVLRNLAQLCH